MIGNLKYIQFLFVNITLVKLRKNKNCLTGWESGEGSTYLLYSMYFLYIYTYLAIIKYTSSLLTKRNLKLSRIPLGYSLIVHQIKQQRTESATLMTCYQLCPSPSS